MSEQERPYWLTDAKVDGGVYLGFTKGEWPIQAFAADGSHAAYWAAQDPERRVLVGPIEVPTDAPVLYGRTVPTAYELVPEEAR